MQAYLNDPKLKRAMLREMRAHEKADAVHKGTYGEVYSGQWRGCAIGCALHSLNRITTSALQETGDHARFPAELGIPIELAYTIDHIFENLPTPEAEKFPRAVLAAIPVGKDLGTVMPALLQWAILDPRHGWIVYAKTEAHRATVQRFAAAVAADWQGHTVSGATWEALDQELAAIPEWACAEAWAWARAWAWAGAGAWAGAWAGAGARAWAWAWAGAWADYYTPLAKELQRLLREA